MEGKWVKAKKEGNSWFAVCPFCGHICVMVESDDEGIINTEWCEHLEPEYEFERVQGKWVLEMYFEVAIPLR